MIFETKRPIPPSGTLNESGMKNLNICDHNSPRKSGETYIVMYLCGIRALLQSLPRRTYNSRDLDIKKTSLILK